MAKDTQLADAIVNGQADYLSDQLDNGYLRIYSGTKPATADAALSGNTLLAELRFNGTAAPAASGGVLTFNAISSDTSADATGTATFFRCFKSDGTTAVMDGTVGTSDANLVLSTTSITAGQTVAVTSFTYDVKNAQSGL